MMLGEVRKALENLYGQRVGMCLGDEMAKAIEEWAQLYEGNAPWISKKCGIKSAGLPAAISAEVARLATLELQSKASSPTVDAPYQAALEQLRIHAEQGIALGGMVIKPYPTQEGVGVQFIRADRFFPISFDASGNMSECVFVDQSRVGKKVYTRLELHSLRSGTLTISNTAYMSESDASLGNPIPLEQVGQWQHIEPITTRPAKKLPIGYFRVPLANTVDPDSPLGVSIFARAISQIEEADARYSNECWEIKATQAAVHIAQSMVRMSKETGKPEVPDGMERLYRMLDYETGATDRPLLDIYSPAIRDASLKSLYQDQLRRIEFICGLAYGTISDPQATDKTATEVRASKQRLYATVTDIQMALEDALTDFAEAIAFWLNAPPSAMEFTWDDSIVVDSDALAARALLEHQSGIIDSVEYFQRVYGMELDAATKLATDIKARTPKPETTDFFASQREDDVQ